MVIIPHPTELLKLTKFQKQLIKDNFSEENLITRIIPLWINLPQTSNCNSLKQIANSITKIELESPLYSKESLFLPVTIYADNTVINSRLELLHSKKQLKKISTEEISFPLCLKIFRVAENITLEPNGHAITSAIWKKL